MKTYKKNNLSINVILTIIFLIIYFLIIPQTCTDEEGARDVLIKYGYHPIEVGGYAFFIGSSGDAYITKFKAYTPDSSMIITGIVTTRLSGRKVIQLD